jgi:moderate conductance mechanosensitive channel
MSDTWLRQLETLTPWLTAFALSVGASALRLVIVIVIGHLAIRFVRIGLQRLEGVLIRAARPTEAMAGATQKRVVTLVGMIQTLAVVIVWSIVVVVGLSQVGLDITPILAGAGIAGLAVGFGAQNLVRDLITGFFVVLENHVRVGDIAVINGTGGLVEMISFRTIVLRDEAGIVHVFPHGTVNTLANMTKDWSGYVLDIGVAYQEDTDRVVGIMRQVADELQRDAALGPAMLGPIEIFGVDNFGDSGVRIKARLKTHPLRQWDVGREYRRRLKRVFDAERIQMPFAHHSLSFSEASHPLALRISEPPPAR